MTLKIFSLLQLAAKTHFVENIEIIEDDDDYGSSEDYSQDTTQNIPNKYIVELKEASENQIDDVMKSTVNTTTPTSIYDFQGKL